MILTEVKANIDQLFTRIKTRIPGFIHRDSQEQMIDAVCSHLVDGKIAAIEGPTGTGKTLAYLTAAIPVALAHEKPLIISSATVALQEQLLNKDIPLIQKHGGLDFSVQLAKGRGRYVCINRMYDICSANQQQDLFEYDVLFDEAPKVSDVKLINRLFTSYKDGKWDGDIDSIKFNFPRFLWSRINNNFFSCSASLCQWYRDCRFFKERRKLAKVDVIVANHDLVLTDIARGGGALPPVNDCFYIFDEAHKLPEKALNHFSASAPVNGSAIIFAKIEKYANINRKSLQQKEQIPAVTELAHELVTGMKEFFELLNTMGAGEILAKKEIMRFPFGVVPAEIVDFGKGRIIQPLTKLNKQLGNALEEAKSSPDDPAAEQEAQVLGAFAGAIADILTTWEQMVRVDDKNSPPHARWISQEHKGDYTLNVSPITVREQLHDFIWQRCRGAVLTSATLSALGKFNRFRSRTGLDKNESGFISLPSPFDLKQVRLEIPFMQSTPKQREQHTAEMITVLSELLKSNKGFLVLFTARSQMHDVYEGLDKSTREDILLQGSMARTEILSCHKAKINKNKRSILFGLDSFSEGLDLPGKLCEHLIIAKLPFAVPTSPVEEAGSEWLESINRNYFQQVSVPDAAIKLTQACGRLMRNESDAGIITIFDSRLLTTSYGDMILRSLPEYELRINRPQ